MIEVNSVGFLRKRDINFKRKEIRVLWKVDSHANYIYFIPITFHALRFQIKKVSIRYESKLATFRTSYIAEHRKRKNQHAPHRRPFRYSSLSSSSLRSIEIVLGMLLPLVIRNAWNIKMNQRKSSFNHLSWEIVIFPFLRVKAQLRFLHIRVFNQIFIKIFFFQLLSINFISSFISRSFEFRISNLFEFLFYRNVKKNYRILRLLLIFR